MSIQNLILAVQEQEKLEAKIFALKESVKQDMIAKGIETLETKAGNLSLKSLAKKNRKAKPAQTAEIAELEIAISQERQELIDSNKQKLYELNKQKDMAELQMSLLLSNEWTDALETKLEEAKQKAIAESMQKPSVGYIELEISLAERDYISLAGDAWLSKAINEAKAIKPRKMTRPMVLSFVSQYFKGYYPDMPIDEAWQKRVKDHVAYWVGKQ